MGGILGIFDCKGKLNSEEKSRILTRMSDSLKYRGNKVGYINKNLISLAVFKPIVSTYQKDDDYSNNQDIVCILDGVIYNSKNLIKNIDEDSAKNKELPDNNILENLYRKEKEDFINHLDGEFSLAIWNNTDKKLILGRDQFGNKPLFYCYKNDFLVFSSDIKAILQSKIIQTEINPPAINDFMSYGYIPHPDTMFKDIYQIDPGSILIIDREKITKKLYWEYEYKTDDEKDEKYYIETFLDLFEKSIRKRINNDYPMGANLSGGIDSSGVCGVLGQYIKKPFKAFSIGFEDAEFNELPLAKEASEWLNLDWVSEVVNPGDITNLFERTVYLYDTPFEDTSAIPSYFGAKLASKYAKIILTGDAPDQFLAGSNHHKTLQSRIINDKLYLKILRYSGLKNIFHVLPVASHTEQFLDKLKRRVYQDSLSFRERIFEFRVTPLLLKRFLYSKDLLKIDKQIPYYRNINPVLDKVKNRHPIEQSLYYDLYFYMHDCLIPKVEGSCVMNSIECRNPYRDKDLIQFFETVPLKYRINGLETKYLLKKAFSGLLPDTILFKKKQGFAIPRDNWYINDFQDYIKGIILDKKSYERGYFNRKALEQVVQRFFSGSGSYYSSSSSLITSLLTLELWHKIYIDKELVPDLSTG